MKLALDGRPQQEDLLAGVFADIAKSITFDTHKQETPDIIEWILNNHMVNERGFPFEFEQRYFLVEMMREWEERQQCMYKGSQIGFSTSVFLKECFGAKFYRYNFIHTLPSLPLVRKFVPVKVDETISANPILKKMVGRGTSNSIQKKRMDKGWLFWAGCKGENEDILDTADCIVNDEIDHSDPIVVEGFESRMSASTYKGRWDFSNPTTDGNNISQRWKVSTQAHLHHRCSRCNEWFYNDFYNCIDENAFVYICPKCKQPLREEDRCTGTWVKKWQQPEVMGWWVNHLICPWIGAKETITAYHEKSDDYFHRFVLAWPRESEETRISREAVLRNCTEEVPKRDVVVAGVDQGDLFHMVIGNKEGFFKLQVEPSWDKVEQVIHDFNIQTAVVDYLPDVDGALELAKKLPGKILLNQQNRDSSAAEVIRFDEKRGFVYTDKHPMITQVLKAFLRGEIKVFYDPDDVAMVGTSRKDYKSYCAQAETLYRTEETNQNGFTRLVWRSTNTKDHWYLATCYWYAAKERLRQAEAIHPVEDISVKIPQVGSREWLLASETTDWYHF
jgi:hypothetical protein